MLQQISTCTSIVEEAPLLQKAPLIGAAPTGSQQCDGDVQIGYGKAMRRVIAAPSASG